MKYLNENDVENILLGSSIYSTGGGLSYSKQKPIFDELISQGVDLKLIDISELDPCDHVCTVYGVGSPADDAGPLEGLMQDGLQALTEFTGKRFSAVFPVEANIEAAAFQAAASLDVPVLDADAVGGRAVPTATIDNFLLAGEKVTPVVAVSGRGQIKILADAQSGEEIENFVREQARKSLFGVVIAFDHAVPVSKASRLLSLGSISRSLELGKALDTLAGIEEKIETVLNKTSGAFLMKGVISQVNLETKNGFLGGEIEISSVNKSARVFVKNENIALIARGKEIITAPDLITLLDLRTGYGVQNASAKAGTPVAVIGIPAEAKWRTIEGIESFSPRSLGIEAKTRLLVA